jgi:hypothetical protein
VPELRELLRHVSGPADVKQADGVPEYPTFSASKDVCARYRISAKTLERRRKEGAFPGAVRKHGRWQYPASALRHYERWLLDSAEHKANESPAVDGPDHDGPPPDLAGLSDWRQERSHGE